jgi:hypothetical protein
VKKLTKVADAIQEKSGIVYSSSLAPHEVAVYDVIQTPGWLNVEFAISHDM